MKVIIVNGPNLNLLGKRNRVVYGDVSFEEYYKGLTKLFPSIALDYYQSNIEGELIDKIQEVGFSFDYIILNAGGYTHTSVAIADCVEAVQTPVIEVHVSNIYARESYRQHSLLHSVCVGSVFGLGVAGYRLALDYIINN